jgi:hypothetical protein
LADACSRHRDQRAYVDVLADNRAAVAQAESLGMNAQRRLTRMHRGRPPTEQLSKLWASSGPEMG